MNKMLSAVLLTFVFASAFCYMPYNYLLGGMYPYGGMFNLIESETDSVPDNGHELLRKYNDLNCLMQRFGERCWYDYSVSILRTTEDCEIFIYEGCINNQTRFYNAEMCRGVCRLPSSNANAPVNGDSVQNPVTISSLNQPGISSPGAIPPSSLNQPGISSPGAIPPSSLSQPGISNPGAIAPPVMNSASGSNLATS